MNESTSDSESFSDVANLYLLTKCDMECPFCYASKNLERFSIEQAQSVLSDLADSGATRVNLTGGEILMHPGALEVVTHARDIGLAVTMFTSGSLLSEKQIKKFCPLIEWLALSLDGDEVTNLAMGRSKRHFQSTIAALDLVRRLAPDVKVRVATVVTTVNVNKLRPIAEILSKPQLRPNVWSIKQMLPTRRAKEALDELGVIQEAFDREVSAIKDEFGHLLTIRGRVAEDKVADTMCIHPDGHATVTIGEGFDLEIFTLGNVLEDSREVFRNWNARKGYTNSHAYNQMWET